MRIGLPLTIFAHVLVMNQNITVINVNKNNNSNSWGLEVAESPGYLRILKIVSILALTPVI